MDKTYEEFDLDDDLYDEDDIEDELDDEYYEDDEPDYMTAYKEHWEQENIH